MLTPQQLQEISFEKVRFGGYDMSSVDDLLEPLTQDYVTLYKENSILKSKMRILVEKLEEYRRQEASMQSAILAAQKTCDDMVKEAEKKCARMLREAQETADANAQKDGRQAKLQKAILPFPFLADAEAPQKEEHKQDDPGDEACAQDGVQSGERPQLLHPGMDVVPVNKQHDHFHHGGCGQPEQHTVKRLVLQLLPGPDLRRFVSSGFCFILLHNGENTPNFRNAYPSGLHEKDTHRQNLGYYSRNIGVSQGKTKGFSCLPLPNFPDSYFFLKLSFRETLRLKTRWPGAASWLSRQK